MKTQRIAEILKSGNTGCDITVKGWVRTKRGNKNVAFIALNDGSCVANIQIVVDLASFNDEQLKLITTGACIHDRNKGSKNGRDDERSSTWNRRKYVILRMSGLWKKAFPVWNKPYRKSSSRARHLSNRLPAARSKDGSTMRRRKDGRSPRRTPRKDEQLFIS